MSTAVRAERGSNGRPETITGYEVITTADAESAHRPVTAGFDLARAAGHGDHAGAAHDVSSY